MMKEKTSFRRNYAMLYNTYRFLFFLFLFFLLWREGDEEGSVLC